LFKQQKLKAKKNINVVLFCIENQYVTIEAFNVALLMKFVALLIVLFDFFFIMLFSVLIYFSVQFYSSLVP